MFPFFVIGIFILIQVPASLCVAEEYYQKCSSSYRCANINISYPFWGGGRPENCGYPGFELNCQGDAPQITSGTTNYSVLGIDSSSRTLKVGVDYWHTVCPQYLVNTTLDFNLSGYISSPVQNLTLFYGCTAMVEPVPGFTTSNQFSCSINGTDSIGYYLIGNNTRTSAAESCSNSVVVPISQKTAQTLETNLTAASGQSPNLTAALNGGFELQWFANNPFCDQCANSGGQCGYNQTTRAFICYCTNGTFEFMCEVIPSATGSASTNQVPLTVGLAVGGAGVFGFIVACIVVTCCRKRGTISSKTMVFWKKETKIDQNVEEFIRNHGSLTLKRYSYSYIRKMTKSFKEKLGQGGYGDVYKGKLCDDRLVAVKVLSESKGNGEEFINEVASISRTSHVNIVTLLGFSYERTRRALIYEFMANGSLDKFIYDKGSSNANRHLEWKTLYQIAIGIARGLEYLHRGCNTRILHFDIKPHNILLDEDFCPKISDFGLAKLCERKESVISMLGTRGTVGYIAPEVFCRNFGGVSHKSDVYSYGMMVLEMVGGRKNIDPGVSRTSEIYFPHWIYEPLKLGKELKLHGITTQEEEEITRKMILVSLWCIQTNPSDRPSMTKVVEMLEGSLQSLQIPPKPFLSSPPRPPIHSSTTSLS